MALTEPQIRRYARHILLSEVGGVGQERLLAAEAHVAGEPALVELAAAYLTAAGVTCDAHSGPGLGIRIAGAEAGVVVALGEGSVVVQASRCPDCRGIPTGPLPGELGYLAAALAASEVLRLVLDLGAPERSWSLRGLEVSPMPPRRCARHQRSD